MGQAEKSQQLPGGGGGRDQEERKPSIILVIVILDIHSVFRRRQVGARERYSLPPLLCRDLRYPTVSSAMELGKPSYGRREGDAEVSGT